MLIKRDNFLALKGVIERFKKEVFNISLQYKFIKILKQLNEEEEIYEQQIKQNCMKYFETDKDGKYIISEDGGYKIINGKEDECYDTVRALGSIGIQVQDLYFGLDELSTLGLSLEELSLFEPFIKN